MWAFSHFRAYLYGHKVTVYTDHSAVKAILGTPNLSGKHARWWTKVYSNGVNSLQIIHRSGKENVNADALSRNPLAQPAEDQLGPCQVAALTTQESLAEVSDNLEDIQALLNLEPDVPTDLTSFSTEQRKDSQLVEIIQFLTQDTLPSDESRARKVALQAPLFAVIQDTLYFLDKPDTTRTEAAVPRRVAVPKHLQRQIMEECHGGSMGGHFSGRRLFSTLSRRWWWERMYTDALEFCRNCPQCAVVTGASRIQRPALKPIPIDRVFQVIGMDIMELPKTTKGNQYVLVFQDFLSKFPLVFPIPDQKTERIAKLLVEQVIPFFGVPEALLSDRGANMLSHLMTDICTLLGIKKLNTTAYHPQCDGMVERFNRTLKSMLRKNAAEFGVQWDKYLHGVLWAYRNSPHESTGEKPSFLLFVMDCRTPTEAAFLPPFSGDPVNQSEFRETLILTLASARELALTQIKKSQAKYKKYYDRRSTPISLKQGDLVLVKFPHEETGRYRKLSRPWYGPYRVLTRQDPDVTVTNVYFPEDGPLHIHLTRVKPCPSFPTGFYWYGPNRQGRAQPPRWITRLFEGSLDEDEEATGSRYDLRRFKPRPSARDELASKAGVM